MLQLRDDQIEMAIEMGIIRILEILDDEVDEVEVYY
jgi:hypothetical protein